MNLDRIRRIQRRERRGDDLVELDDSFFDAVAEYLSELKEEAAEDSEKLDELRSARRAFQGVFDRRLNKILGMVGASPEIEVKTEPMTPEERDLFGELESAIDSHRRLLRKPQKANKDREEEKEVSDLTAVRVLEEIEEFVGTDGETYRLQEDDVVNLPRQSAEILISKGAAEEI